MFFGFILFRIILLASLIMVLGYVFGNFSQRKSLTRLTKVSSVLLLVVFVIMNFFMFRFYGKRHFGRHQDFGTNCPYVEKDSTHKK